MKFGDLCISSRKETRSKRSIYVITGSVIDPETGRIIYHALPYGEFSSFNSGKNAYFFDGELIQIANPNDILKDIL